jgi:2-polyprenyl-6-methoxyphenol hydroxylase-like FAD-dependent oxidoreductase
MNLPSETQVLIVGAGPSGLALATCLAGHGVDHVLVDRLDAPPPTSRAAAVHARTLEVLGKLGVSDTMVAAGRSITTLAMQERDKTLLQIGFEQIPSRYQFVLALPQNETEAILARRLEALGGGVRRGQEAVAVAQDDAGATVTLRDAGGTTASVRARYVVGADGYHSAVRQSAGIGFSAGTYAQTFVLADLHMDWPLGADVMRVFFAPEGMLLVVPFSEDRYRIVATVDSAEAHPTLGDTQALLDQRGPASLPGRARELVWSSRFRIHHGVADRYRAGRIFLAGDAAHVHSPAGGQGMNIGVQDAVALGDRLAAVIGGREPEASLDEYEAERRPVAQQVVAETDRMTKMGTLSGAVGQRLRNMGLQMIGHLPVMQRRIATRIAELDG